ncbi:hypothetical protein F3J16_10005 [Burkholderia sp. Ap-962]|uniref:Cap15 family cyclic dinucleotide receptor domain-containing protein n=1 Tax=Burkholderia sp. Ap-962 TaxID=2608333 RepID=UPI0014246E26|nr:hypothetical protein [Burkholderia sp. Ap-962]NIF70514.1 hypothetical protein [Burkholderia sp. Ap-962]
MADHEYSILNHDRGQVFHWIGAAISVAAAWYAAAAGVLGIFLEKYFPSLPNSLPKALDSALAFVVLYYVFNRWVWRWFFCKMIFKFHDISGTWEVQGTTLGPSENLAPTGAPRPWKGEMKIKQQWTKISVRLETGNSESFSKSAALQDDDGKAQLMYAYGNSPNVRARAQASLQNHVGYCELIFSEDGKTATGFYFNNMGRVTHGEMQLTKRS